MTRRSTRHRTPSTARASGPRDGEQPLYGSHPATGGPLMMSVRLGAGELLGIAPSWEAAAERLRPYPLETVLDVVGRISVLLQGPGHGDLAFQLRVCDGLLPEHRSAYIRRRFADLAARAGAGAPRPGHVLFDELTLAAAVKVACAVCAVVRRTDGDGAGGVARAQSGASDDPPRDGRDGPNVSPVARTPEVAPPEVALQLPRSPYQGIGEALLVLNDLVDQNPTYPVDYDLDALDGRLQWVRYFLLGSAEPGRDAGAHAMARAVELFLTNHADLAADPDVVDLPALFAAATGLTVERSLRLVLAFTQTLLAITPENVAQRAARVPAARLRAAGLGQDLDRFLAWVGADAPAFRDEVRERYPAGDLRAYDVLPLAQHPLVRFGAPGSADEQVVCHSVARLQDRVTEGLYHTLLNAYAPDERAARDRFQRFVGRAFEAYVDRLLRRTYGHIDARPYGSAREPGGAAPRRVAGAPGDSGNRAEVAHRPPRRLLGGRAAPHYYGETALRAAIRTTRPRADQIPLCDGLLVWGNAAVVFECKSGLFSLPARAGENAGAFRARLEEIVVRGAGQLDRSIELLLSGAFRNLGAEPDQVAHVFPALVTLERLPTDIVLRWWVDDRLGPGAGASGGADEPAVRRVGGARVYPVELLHVSDLEWAEAAHARGVGLPSTLRIKHGDHWGRNHSLSAYATVRGLPGAAWGSRNPHLAREYDRLTAGPWHSLRQLLGHAAPRAAGP